MSDLRQAYEKADKEYNMMVRARPDVSRRSKEDQQRIDEALSRRLRARYDWQRAEPSATIF